LTRTASISTSSTATEVVGVDGARGGWVAATRAGVQGFARFADVVATHPEAALFVDIPIGLAQGDRACDKAARRALGPRRASVFPPPSRAQLALADMAWRPGLGINRQTHALLPMIREVDAFAADRRVREAHPELAFLLASGRPLASKKTAEGRAQRARVLHRLGLRFDATGMGVGAKRDDVDDAAILVWLGEEALAGRVGFYGEAPFVIWGAPQTPRPSKP
jgi:predicted RNase H-like nuclease